jgi:hypothetical protein
MKRNSVSFEAELNSYILLRRISSFEGLNIEVHYPKNKGHGKYV